MARTAIAIPTLDVRPNDLVTCTVTLNSVPVFSILQEVLRTLRALAERIDEVEGQIGGVRDDMGQVRVELEERFRELAVATRKQVDNLRADVMKDVKSMREESNEQFLQQLNRLQQEVTRTRLDVDAEVKVREQAVQDVEDKLQSRIKEEVTSLSTLVDTQVQHQMKPVAEHTAQIARLEKAAALHEEEITGVYDVFELHKPRVLSLSKNDAPSQSKVEFLHLLPAFTTLADAQKRDTSRVDAKFDALHRRVGASEQALSKKADQTELDDLACKIDTHDLEEELKRHNAQILKLYTITDHTEKALQVGLEKKADRDRVDTVEGDVLALEGRLRMALESVGNNRWQQLMDKVSDLDVYLQKVDRRKVGRSEFQRMAKRLRMQVTGDVAYDGAWDMGGTVSSRGGAGGGGLGGGGGGGGTFSPGLDMAGGQGLGVAGIVCALSPTGGGGPSRVASPGAPTLPGIDAHLQPEGGGPDAAYIRYRCLSCNKPTTKLVDEGARRASAAGPPPFPANTMLSTNPNAPAAMARLQGEGLSPFNTPAARQDRRMENYFHWVEGYASEEEEEEAEASPARHRSPSPPAADPGARRVRTNVPGRDHKVYAGVQEVSKAATLVVEDHNAALQQLSRPSAGDR
eukprot:EG_transcript_4538